MTDYAKVSELTAATSVADADLLEISQDQGGGAFLSKKVTAANSVNSKLPLAGGTLTGNLVVSKADPEVRLTDTGNSEYARATRSDTTNLAAQYNRVLTYPPGPTGGTIVYLDSDKANPRSSPAFAVGIDTAGGNVDPIYSPAGSGNRAQRGVPGNPPRLPL